MTLSDYLNGKKHSEFARKIAISPAYLSQILSGQRRPAYDLMWKIENETGGAVGLADWPRREKEKKQTDAA